VTTVDQADMRALGTPSSLDSFKIPFFIHRGQESGT